MKKISFSDAGRLMRESFRLGFLNRKDVLTLSGGLIIASCLFAAIRQMNWPDGISGHGVSAHFEPLMLGGLDTIAMWFLTLTVTRASLTPWQGVALWRLDRGALQSLGVNVIVQGLPTVLTLLVASSLSDYVNGSAGFSAKARGMLFLCLLGAFWIWLIVRCLMMSYVAWESGHAGFRIRRSFEAMKGHVWSYVFWNVVMAIPFALATVLVEKITASSSPGTYLIGACLVVATLIAAAHHVVSRSFDLRFFQALALDRPEQTGMGNLFGSS